MRTFHKGQRIRIFGYEAYPPTSIFRVEKDFGDHLTVRNVATGELAEWVLPAYCHPVGERVGWDFLKEVLTRETLELLGAFDGVESLVLRDDAASDTLRQQPDLASLIREQLAVEHLLDVTEPELVNEDGLPMPTAADLAGRRVDRDLGGRVRAKVLTDALRAFAMSPEHDDLTDLWPDGVMTAEAKDVDDDDRAIFERAEQREEEP